MVKSLLRKPDDSARGAGGDAGSGALPPGGQPTAGPRADHEADGSGYTVHTGAER